MILFVLLGAVPLGAQLAPPSTGGAPALDRLLQQLGDDRRVLLIGAHPDDEDTRLLTLLARGWGVEAAYLSLTRGDGGQNLIGPELGVGLGLLRSRELEAARAVDGARQFVTRAFDFGYTRSLDEAMARWPRDSVLKDAARIVRRFRPHVIVSVFSGTDRDGHGQHQMAGVIAHEVFDAAGDPAQFPELASEEGLEPWQPLKLFRGSWFRIDSTSVVLDAGGIDPRDGRTYHQIAMASRSRHSSQDMGRLQDIGPNRSAVSPAQDRTGAGWDDFFAGVPADDSWLARSVDSVRASVSAVDIDAAVPVLNAMLARWRREDGDERRDALLGRAVLVASGVLLDATADAERLVPGSDVGITVGIHNAGARQVVIDRVRIRTPVGWTSAESAEPLVVPAGEYVERPLTVRVPLDAPFTQPYFLRAARQGDMYDWTGTDPAVRGELFDAALLGAEVALQVDGGPGVLAAREVTYRYNDQAVGEIRRPLVVVPRIGVRMSPTLLVWSTTGAREAAITVDLTHFASDTADATAELHIDEWDRSYTEDVRFTRAGETHTVVFRAVRPEGAREGSVTVRAVVRTADGGVFTRDVRAIEYPHVRPTQWLTDAVGTIRVAPIELPPVAAVGYIRGASDRVPEALQAIGLPLTMLTETDLAGGDLSQYDVIVVGPRAYETDDALRRHNDRLLAYARAGGRVVVQYQQRQYSDGGYAPLTLEIAQPTARITDEEAPVTVLAPDHPIFRFPNAIRPEDWVGWVQERGLYFADPWDAAFTPLLEMTDPEGNALRGSLLAARYGQGTYIYAALSFFRTIPAGVTGTYRLFLNLLAWDGTGD